MPCYRVIPLGGCTLNIPLTVLRARGKVSSAFLEAGFRQWPLALSPTGALQLLNYGLGKFGIPHELRHICYQDPVDEPRVDSSPIFHSADFMLLNFSTPIDIVMDGFILNQNQLQIYTRECVRNLSDDTKKLAKIWYSHGLGKQNEKIRAESAEVILRDIDKDGDIPDLFKYVLKNCSSIMLDEAEMMNNIESLVNMLGISVILIFHNFSYMPDGRATSWPQNFKKNIKNISRALKIVNFDPEHLVTQYGVSNAIAEDSRHYKDGFNAVVADQYLKMMDEQF